MTHTPGPWHTDGRVIDYADPDDGFITALAAVYDEDENTLPVAENRANAYLMAASPDLLAACKAALAYLAGIGLDTDEDGEAHPEYEQLRAAIARAEPRA